MLSIAAVATAGNAMNRDSVALVLLAKRKRFCTHGHTTLQKTRQRVHHEHWPYKFMLTASSASTMPCRKDTFVSELTVLRPPQDPRRWKQRTSGHLQNTRVNNKLGTCMSTSYAALSRRLFSHTSIAFYQLVDWCRLGGISIGVVDSSVVCLVDAMPHDSSEK